MQIVMIDGPEEGREMTLLEDQECFDVVVPSYSGAVAMAYDEWSQTPIEAEGCCIDMLTYKWNGRIRDGKAEYRLKNVSYGWCK